MTAVLARSSSPSMGPSSTVGSPVDALVHYDALRARWFTAIAVVLALAGIGSVLALPGDPTVSALLLGAMAVTIVAIAWLYRRTNDVAIFQRTSTALGWLLTAACASLTIPYFGSFSPVLGVLVFLVYFAALGQGLVTGIGVYVICAGAQALVSTLVILGFRDTGIMAPVLATRDQVISQVLIQLILLTTFVAAWLSRRSALAAVSELERAVRIAAHREALLLEAREELEHAKRDEHARFKGQLIGGYQLGSLIGRGAMGEVFEAEGPAGRVAIKLLSQASRSNPQHVRRFLRELRTATGVRSPHIVHVIDVGEHPVPYLVMERLEGITLGELLRTRGSPMPGSEVVEMVRQLGAGIAAAAAAGIVHRDLKPENVFLDRGTWKIVDFGVARAMDQGDTLTAGAVVGTPVYMAPEQASGRMVDHRADLYALATIAYRALTGHRPFVAGDIAETLYRVVHTPPLRPSDLAELSPEVDLVLAIGMAKHPEQRFASADELAAALAAAFAGDLPRRVFQRGRALEEAGAWLPGGFARAGARSLRAKRISGHGRA